MWQGWFIIITVFGTPLSDRNQCCLTTTAINTTTGQLNNNNCSYHRSHNNSSVIHSSKDDVVLSILNYIEVSNNCRTCCIEIEIKILYDHCRNGTIQQSINIFTLDKKLKMNFKLHKAVMSSSSGLFPLP